MRTVLLLITLFFLQVYGTIYANPNIWRVEKINLLKLDENIQLRLQILRVADSILQTSPIIITDKELSFASDKHFYCSIAPYWWPNPSDPMGPYIWKDGSFNPDRNNYDYSKLERLAYNLQYLSVSYYITKKRKYLDYYISQLNDWFVNEETMMYPNLDYAQVIRGHNENKGRSTGIVETEKFIPIVESMLLVQKASYCNRLRLHSSKKWFKSFVFWLICSDFGKKINEENNNIALLYDIAIVEFASLNKDKTIIKQISQSFAEKRIYKQIQEDGKQPEELSRANPFTYSVRNLKQIVDFCVIMENNGNHFYQKHRKRIDAAFHFLFTYVEKSNDVPYMQKDSWNQNASILKEQMVRLQMLDSSNGNIKINSISEIFN